MAPNGDYLALASVPEALDANANAVLTMAEQKELQRKEKAMAEMAALLVLQKSGRPTARRSRKANQRRLPAKGD